MGSKGGGGGSQTQRTEPWSVQGPYLQQGFQQAQNLYNSGGPQYYPGATYVPFSSQTEQGLGLTEQRALQGSPVTQSAQNLATETLQGRPQFGGAQSYLQGPGQQALQQTASGQSLQGNPYLDQTFDHAAQRVTDTFNRDISPGIAAQFSQAGRTGSDAQADVQTQAAGQVSDSLSQLSNQIYGGNYQQERDRQLNAANQLQSGGLQSAGIDANVYGQQLGQQTSLAGLSNSLANQDYKDIDKLLGVGGRVEGLGQQALQSNIDRHNFYQNLPQQNLANYIAAIQGNYGGTQNSTQNAGSPNRLQGAAGGAIAGGQAFGPWGALAGGVLGALG